MQYFKRKVYYSITTLCYRGTVPTVRYPEVALSRASSHCNIRKIKQLVFQLRKKNHSTAQQFTIYKSNLSFSPQQNRTRSSALEMKISLSHMQYYPHRCVLIGVTFTPWQFQTSDLLDQWKLINSHYYHSYGLSLSLKCTHI